MNLPLVQLANANALDSDELRAIRYAFAHACAERVRYQLEQPRAVELLDVLRDYVAGHVDDVALQAANEAAQALANQHRGSPSIDGSQIAQAH
ncbi:MAG: hypothetical protein JNL19_07450 [Burkholderiales bacterium]|nr:hypothetical protein [Burkholderiales bacterium]